MTNPTMCSGYFGPLLRKAVQCASIQRLHGVVSRRYMESYSQYNVQSVFSFGLDSAVQLFALALHLLGREKERKEIVGS